MQQVRLWIFMEKLTALGMVILELFGSLKMAEQKEKVRLLQVIHLEMLRNGTLTMIVVAGMVTNMLQKILTQVLG